MGWLNSEGKPRWLYKRAGDTSSLLLFPGAPCYYWESIQNRRYYHHTHTNTMIATLKLSLLPAVAAVAAAAVLPVLVSPTGLTTVRDPIPEGGFVKHCCMHPPPAPLSLLLQWDFLPFTKKEATKPNMITDTHTVGERGELVGRLIGNCGDDELFDMLHYTWLDLNYCLGNNNGELAWQDKYVMFSFLLSLGRGWFRLLISEPNTPVATSLAKAAGTAPVGSLIRSGSSASAGTGRGRGGTRRWI